MSNAYFARPVALAPPSRRGTRVPRRTGLSGHGYFSCLVGWAAALTSGTCGDSATGHPLRIEHGFEHAGVGAASTNVAGERRLRLIGGRRRRLLEQRDGRDDKPGRAETAHQAVVLAERLLHGMEDRSLGQPFYGPDRHTLHVNREKRAGIVRSTVHDDGTGTARATIANALEARDVEPIAHCVEQRDARFDRQRMRLAVDGELDWNVAWPNRGRARLRAGLRRTQHAGRQRRGADGLEECSSTDVQRRVAIIVAITVLILECHGETPVCPS